MFNQTKHNERKHFCMYSLQCSSSEKVLMNCMVVNGKEAIKRPEKGNNILKLKNLHNQLNVPFVIYVDFEAITEKINICE